VPGLPLVPGVAAGEIFHKAGILMGASRVCAGTHDVPGGGGMARQHRESPLARAARGLQENVSRSGPVAGASYTLIGAIILLGGIGYTVDAWQQTAPWGLVIGLTLGIVVGFYELAKTVWRR